MTASTQISYVINEKDTITSVERDCPDNGSQFPRLSSSEILVGESFWSVVASWEIASFYRLILETVRQQGQSVTVPFRCERLKFLNGHTITFSPLPNNQVLATTKSGESPNKCDMNPVERKACQEQFVYRCSWCQSNRMGDESLSDDEESGVDLEGEGLDLTPVTSHGICPDCFQKELSDFELEEQRSTDR